MTKIKPCANKWCEESSTGTYCRNCRAGELRWSKRSAAERLERRRKLNMYNARLDDIVDDRKILAHAAKARIQSVAEMRRERDARDKQRTKVKRPRQATRKEVVTSATG